MDPNLRISDAEREQAAATLGEHYAEGRLDTDEHAERLDAIWSARTGADLTPIFEDLPRGHHGATAPGRSPERRNRPRSGPGAAWRIFRALPLLPVIAILVVLSVITHLPFWILIFFVACGAWGHRSHRWAGQHHAHGWR